MFPKQWKNFWYWCIRKSLVISHKVFLYKNVEQKRFVYIITIKSKSNKRVSCCFFWMGVLFVEKCRVYEMGDSINHIFIIPKIFNKIKKRTFYGVFRTFPRESKKRQLAPRSPSLGLFDRKAAAASLYFQSLHKSFMAASSAAFMLFSII